jgi:hypothetical protein
LRNASVFLVSWLIVLLISCSTVYHVAYDYDRGTDFTKLKTYGWLPLRPEDQISKLSEKRIQTAVNNQLGSKGYKRVSKNPDFSIVAKVGTKEEYWYGSGYYGYRYAHKIEAGTLLLDFVNQRDNRLIWRGEAAGVLDDSYSSEKLDKLVSTAVEKILKDFPPPYSQELPLNF